jgi:aspartate-semialdehyde dehydrogenase
MGYRVVVAGATGNVGREMLNILAEREFPVDEIAALASRKSLGTEVQLWRQDPEDQGPRHVRLHRLGHRAVRHRLGGDQEIRAQGRQGRLRGDRQLLALPLRPRRAADRARGEPEAVDGYAKKNIIANPNCSTAQMVVALKPLHDRAKIKRVVVSTYQSVSGAGKDGMDELWDQTKGMSSPVRRSPRSSPSRSPST